MLGFVHMDAGSVRFFGMDWVGNAQKIKQRIGYISGGVSFYPSKKPRVMMEVTRSFYPEWDEAKALAQLSEGMKLALALSHRDEPLDILIDLQREGVSILCSTHIASDLKKCADDILYFVGRFFVDAGKPVEEAGLFWCI